MLNSPLSGARIGPFWFAPGWSRGNAATVWIASLFSIGLAAYMNFVQPFLLNEVLQVPQDQQGTLTGSLGLLQEVVIIGLAGFVGTWSDRIGRRKVYCIGFLLMAVGYGIYPLATSVTELYFYRISFAIGIAIVAVMLSACVVDAIQEPCRGRWVGTNNLLQGLGVVAMSVLLAKAPAWFMSLGADVVHAARYAYWTAAGLALLAAALMTIGLPKHYVTTANTQQTSMLQQMSTALRLGLQNPRLALAYGAAFIGRGDFVVIGAFFSLWIMQTGIEKGMTAGESLARGGMLFGVVQLAAMVWAFFMGMLSDRLNRVTALCVALALAGTGYLLLGNVADPFAAAFIPVALLVGIGEVSVIVAAGALLGQEARTDLRGSIVGFYSAVGGVGILFATGVGGIIFDQIGRTAPFTLMGILNLVLLALGLLVRTRAAKQPDLHKSQP
jgi:MFS family permease